MSKSFWSNLFGSSSSDRFSLGEVKRLHAILVRNQTVTDANRALIVEALRSIAELVIWSDQNDPIIVEYFLTENLLGHFHRILLQPDNREGHVAVQVLQVWIIAVDMSTVS